MRYGKGNFNSLFGAKIIAHNGTFLGVISTAKFGADSIANEFGRHGNTFERDSIFNELGLYGSRLSPFSPFNEHSSTPPKIYLEERFMAYLTCNDFLSPRVDPFDLVEWLGRKM